MKKITILKLCIFFLISFILISYTVVAETSTPGITYGTSSGTHYCSGAKITPDYDINLTSVSVGYFTYLMIFDSSLDLVYNGDLTPEYVLSSGETYRIMGHKNGASIPTIKYDSGYSGSGQKYLDWESGGVYGSNYANCLAGANQDGNLREIEQLTFDVLGIRFTGDTPDNNAFFVGDLTINTTYTGALYNITTLSLYNSSDQAHLIHQINYTGQKYPSFIFNETYINQSKYGNTYYVNVTHTDQYDDIYSITRTFTYSSLEISIIDEVTNDIITGTTEIEIISDSYGANITVIGDDGGNLPDIPVDTYILVYQTEGYNATQYYYVTFDEGENYLTLFNVNTTDGIAITLQLNDLTGDYISGTATLKKFINSTLTTVYVQQFNIENKVNFFLEENAVYTLIITSQDGTTTRTYSNFIADEEGTKTITVPTIAYVPDNNLGEEISWQWITTDQTQIRLLYNDTEESTSIIYFLIYNTTDDSVLYNLSDTDVGYVSFTYVKPNVNESYKACFSATSTLHPYDIDECLAFLGNYSTIGDLEGFTEEEERNIKAWSSFLIMFGVALAISPFWPVAAMVVDLFLMFIFMKLNWFTFGSPTKDYSILLIFAFSTIAMIWYEGNRR